MKGIGNAVWLQYAVPFLIGKIISIDT